MFSTCADLLWLWPDIFFGARFGVVRVWLSLFVALPSAGGRRLEAKVGAAAQGLEGMVHEARRRREGQCIRRA